MRRALILGDMAQWPGTGVKDKLEDYLRHLDVVVDLAATVDEAKRKLSAGGYGLLLMTLYTSSPGDGFHLLDWMLLHGRHAPTIVVDEGVSFTANVKRLRDYRPFLKETLTPEALWENLSILRDTLRDQSQEDAEGARKLDMRQGGPTVRKNGGQESELRQIVRTLRFVFAAVALVGVLWLVVLVMRAAPAENQGTIAALACLIVVSCVFAIFDKAAEKAAKWLRELFRGKGGKD